MQNKGLQRILNTEDIFLAFSFFLFLWIRFHHFDIVLERDEGEFAYAGQEILCGKLPYKDFYNMKFPGVYYINALIFYFLGDSIFAIKTSLLFTNFGSAFFLLRFTNLWYNQQIGKFAAGIFLIFCSCFSAQGWTANAEHFVVFFGLIGIYYSSLFISKQRFKYLIFSGIFLALSTICKQHGFFYILFVFLQLLNFTVLSKFPKINYFQLFKQLSVFVVGIAVPISLMLVYFFQKNIFSEFYFLTFTYASAYTSMETNISEIWHFRPIFWDAFGFWLLFFSMIYCAFRRRKFFKENLDAFLFFACSFAATSMGWYYRAHYFQLMFPAGAIMSAYILFNIEAFWKTKFITKDIYLSLSCIAVLILQSEYIFKFDSITVNNVMYNSYGFNENKWIGDKINQSFRDKKYSIGIIGNEPEIFFYTKKQSSTSFIYNYSLVEKHKYADSITQQYFKQFEESKPEILLYYTDYKKNPKNIKTVHQITDWYNQFKQNYTPIGKLDSLGDKTQLTWLTKEKNTISADSAFYGVIYLRKDIEIPKSFFE